MCDENKVLADRHSWVKHRRVQGWACVDFPISILLIGNLAWIMHARIQDQHDMITIPYDFVFQIAYAYLMVIGITNIPVDGKAAGLGDVIRMKTMSSSSTKIELRA